MTTDEDESQFWKDLRKDMEDPEFAKVFKREMAKIRRKTAHRQYPDIDLDEST